MGMTAILVMWPGPFEQTFVPASQGVSIWNLSLSGPVVSEKMLTDGPRTGGRTPEWLVYYILSAQVS